MNDPVVIDCPILSKGVAVRYRSFTNSGSNEVYLGVGDLGVGGNRTESGYTWSDPDTGTYDFKFQYDLANDRLRESLVNTATLTTPSVNPLFYPSSAGGLLANALSKGIDISTLNAFEILVNNQQSMNIITTVQLNNLVLTTPHGSYTLPNFQPASGTSSLVKYAWPTDSSTPADGFEFSGTIVLDGNFTGSQEGTRVEIQVVNCQNIDPPICLAAGTPVLLTNGQTASIEDLQCGDLIFDSSGNAIPILRCVETGRSKRFVFISKDSLGENCPNRNLFIVAGHPVLIDGKEVDCLELCNGDSIRSVDLNSKIFTICTKRRTFVNIQGLLVGTWGADALANFMENDSTGRKYASRWGKLLKK